MGAVPARPEAIALRHQQRRRVEEHLRKNGVGCLSCGSRSVTVGEALYLGYLFLSEDHDGYLVGLHCPEPHCSQARTAVRMTRSELFGDQ